MGRIWRREVVMRCQVGLRDSQAFVPVQRVRPYVGKVSVSLVCPPENTCVWKKGISLMMICVLVRT